jgi:hypothetical protein
VGSTQQPQPPIQARGLPATAYIPATVQRAQAAVQQQQADQVGFALLSSSRITKYTKKPISLIGFFVS